MESQNVAIVFGPTLLWQEIESGNMALHTVFQSKIVEFILVEYSELFKWMVQRIWQKWWAVLEEY